MRKKSAAGPGSGLADFGSGSTSGFWQRIFFTSGARQTEERGAQSAAGDLPILRDPAEDDISAPTVDWECVFGEARVALIEGSILDFESLPVKIFKS
jgi:hypothetical protein